VVFVIIIDTEVVMKKFFLLLVFLPVFTFAESLYSPTWGFYIDLPEGYDFADGNGNDRFSFRGPNGLMFDAVVYNNRFNTMLDLVEDVNRRLTNQGDVDFFTYNGKQAAIIRLSFRDYSGWGLAVELGSRSAVKPMLLALSYNLADSKGLDFNLFHISALDSISPTEAELRYPGPIMEYSYPRGQLKNVTIFSGINTIIYENDAEASQYLIEREHTIYQNYLNTPYLQEACIRYYRLVYRDSFDRIKNAADAVVRHFNGHSAKTDSEKRIFAQKILSWIQGFHYERFIVESDFLNLVTSITEGVGDCDSHSMLFAIILEKADIRSAIMISSYYGHAMALADIKGEGARFEAYQTQWLVAETTDKVDIGQIAQDVSDPEYWFAVIFE